jgi:flagellar basal-body rod protein FlgB
MNEINTLLKQILDGSAMRNHALTSNIAHANSPSYRRRDVPFRAELKAAIESGKPAELARWRPGIQIEPGTEPIRLESEFAALAENQLWYTTSADFLSRKYARLKSAIFGR